MKSEQEVKYLLNLQKDLLKQHKSECQICSVASNECKTNIVVSDRIFVLKNILSIA
jgi:hypothetical protein